MSAHRHQMEFDRDYKALPGPWEEKAWGLTRIVDFNQVYQKHELLATSGGYCSLHYHKYKANYFKVCLGVVDIQVIKDHYIKTYRLNAGDRLYIPKLVPHIFLIYEDCHMFEEYYYDGKLLDDISESHDINKPHNITDHSMSDDIERLFIGGKTNVTQLPFILLNWDSKLSEIAD